MRLWHQKLIKHLPNKQLGGQWCEIRMILGSIARHGKVNHSTVNYVNDHPVDYLKAYGYLVYLERKARGMYSNPIFVEDYAKYWRIFEVYNGTIYPEHNDEYLVECLENLKKKGIDLYETIS